jgi:thioredoxin-related protein
MTVLSDAHPEPPTNEGLQQSPTPSTTRRFRWGPALLVICVLAFYYVMTRPPPIPEGWGTDFDAAMAEAAATDKRLVVAFSMHGCAPCVAMDRSVLPDKRVREALEAYIPVRVEIDRQMDVAARFGIFGAPTYAVIDAMGSVLAGCEGYQPVDQFIKFLAYGLEAEPPDTAPAGPPPPDDP